MSEADAKRLDRMFTDGLFDPADRKLVRLKVTERNVWGRESVRDAHGWLVEPGVDEVPWALLLTGDAVAVAMPATPADFVEQCRAVLADAAAAPATKPAEDDPDDFFRNFQDRVMPQRVEPAAHLAAWLHRLGHDGLAADMLRAAGGMAEAIEAAEEKGRLILPRREDAWHWYSSAVHAYMARADVEAWFYLRRLAEYFPQAMKEAPAKEDKGHFPGPAQAAQLLAELQRRRKEGIFATPPPQRPADFVQWPEARRIAYLIQQLQEVDARQHGQPGGVDLDSDDRVIALIEIGDPAIPALIDCIESDKRLTRSVHFWRDFAQSRMILGVREAALTAVMSILRTRVFEARSTGDNFTTAGEEAAKATAERLRAYWKTYGALPFDRRMMTILTDEKLGSGSWREAAGNLARYGEERTITTFGYSYRPRQTAVNPLIERFKNPTVAEAIVAAMDRELARHDAAPPDDRQRREIEEFYLGALVELNDRSIIPALMQRLKDPPPSTRMRRLLAASCFRLGEPGPLKAFAQDVREKGARIHPDGPDPASDTLANDELDGVMRTLIFAAGALPEADAALHAMAEPGHPLHDAVASQIRSDSSSDNVWVSHPYALRILRADLDDTSPTGGTYSIRPPALGAHESLYYRWDRGTSSQSLPEPLADPAIRRALATERVCDRAAQHVSRLLLGIPYYHALLKDPEPRLGELRRFLDAHIAHLRRATPAEARLVQGRPYDAYYLLHVHPTDRGATAADVAAGRALFHFDGRGTPLPIKLPAKATLRPPDRAPTDGDVRAGAAERHIRGTNNDDAGTERIEWLPLRALLLQAERGPDGKVYYGLLWRHEMKRVPEDEVTQVESLDEQ